MGLKKTRRVWVWCPDESWVKSIVVRKRVRCPTCNKRLLPREVYDPVSFGIEFIGFKIPPHKTAVKKTKGD